MDEQDRQLISRLSNLVETATATLRSRGSRSNVEQGQEAAAAPETSNNVEDTLKELYPSTDRDRSQSRQGMEIGLGLGLPPASTRFDPRSYRRPKSKKSNRKAQGRSTGSSSSITLTKARSYANNQQNQSETVTLKDVFLSMTQSAKRYQEDVKGSTTTTKNWLLAPYSSGHQ